MLTEIFLTPADGHYFAGYYDKSPLDASSGRLLALRAPFIHRMPSVGETLEVGYFNFPEGRIYHRLSSTAAWNWQQGCMLQWLGPDFRSRILYNDIRDDGYRAIILDVGSGEVRVLPMAAYAVSGDGAFALCVDYERLYWYRPGYNYQASPRLQKRKNLDLEDGIWRLSLEGGSVVKIITMNDVMQLGVKSSMLGAEHWLEHLMINPANRRFAFLHRWRSEGGTSSRLITADVDGSNMYVVNDSGRVSHYCWRDDSTLLGYCGRSTAFNRLRSNRAIAKAIVKPLLPLYHKVFPYGGRVSQAVTGDCFRVMSDLSDRSESIDRKLIPEDGHPTFRPGSNSLIVSDSYPDQFGNCRLYLFDVPNRSVLWEGVVASDPDVRATGYRCDLHPKWSFDGRFVAIDTMSRRGRGMTVYRVDESSVGS